MRVIQEGVVEVAGMVFEPEVFNLEPRMDTNEHECKRITGEGERVTQRAQRSAQRAQSWAENSERGVPGFPRISEKLAGQSWSLQGLASANVDSEGSEIAPRDVGN